MTEEHKPSQNGLPAEDHSTGTAPEKLSREPLIHLEQEGGRTVLTIDLDGIAAEANSAMVKSFENLRVTVKKNSSSRIV
jgi:hypothetical protein